MPVYGFHCKSCGQPFQALVRGNSAPSCPVCDSVDIEQELALSADPAEGGDEGPESSCSSPGSAPGCAGCPSAAAHGHGPDHGLDHGPDEDMTPIA
jgi:putative FmdB family regulatory protein